MTLMVKSPPVQIEPPKGCVEIEISGVTVTVTSLDVAVSQPFWFAYTSTLYNVVVVSTPVLYEF